MTAGAKIYNSMLLDRLRPHTDLKLRKTSEQVGLELSKYLLYVDC